MRNKNSIMVFVMVFVSLLSLGFISSATNHITSGNYDFLGTSYTDELIHETNSIMLRITTNIETTCWYTDAQGVSPSNEFEGNYGNKHETVLENLEEGLHKYYVLCGNSSNPIMEFTFKTSIPIYGTIDLSEEPPLKGGQYEFTLTTSKTPLETPTLEYSLDGITKKDVSLKGGGKTWTGYIIIPDSTGEVIGAFSFSAKDLAGRIGNQIYGDNLFIVDTIKPEIIATINAIGYEGQIRLNWFYYEDINDFNIYRSESENIDFTDFYKTTSKNYFTDTGVEKGKTYYYRVAGIDKAGNIADLSREIYATALLNNVSSSNTNAGLDIKLVGKVDNLISTIDNLIDEAGKAKTNMKSKEGQEKELFLDLRLDKEIENIITELNAHKRDVQNFKLQDLTESELDNKLNSAELKLNIIKKRTPENLILSDEKEIIREVNERDIQRALLEYEDNQEYNYKKEIGFVFDIVEEKKLNIKSKYYSLEIVYMDGSRKEITVVDDNFEGEIENIEGFFFITIIPKNIIEDASEMNIISGNSQIIKSDPVLSFPSETKRVLYYVEKDIPLNSLEQIIISPIKISSEEVSQKITGAVISNYFNGNSFGIIILVLFSMGLLLYFLKIKRDKSPEKPVLKLLEDVKKVDSFLKEKKVEEAKKIYDEIKEEYKKLSKKEKKAVIGEVQKIGGNIKK